MITRSILCLIFFHFLTSCSYHKTNTSSELVLIQITDRNGITETISAKEKIQKMQKIDYKAPQPYQKVLRIFQISQNIENFSVITSYHPNGNLFQYLEIKKTRANGCYEEWHPNGKKKVHAHVIGGPADLSYQAQKEWLFDKTCFAWDEQGRLISRITYHKGFLHENSYYFFPNGKTQKIVPFQQGKIDGEIVEYNENGSLKARIRYEKGKKEGPSFAYWPNEKIQSLEEYDQDKLSEAQYFDQNNRLVSYIQNGKGKRVIFYQGFVASLLEYRNGKQEGEIETFNAAHELTSRYFIKNGKKQGEEIFYYLPEELDLSSSEKTAQLLWPKLSLSWDKGVLHGIVKTWYPNGKLESQRQLSNNKKNGISCGWYENGNIMLLEEYENDYLLQGKYYSLGNKNPISLVEKGMGVATLYDKKGIFLRKVTYHNGKPEYK